MSKKTLLCLFLEVCAKGLKLGACLTNAHYKFDTTFTGGALTIFYTSAPLKNSAFSDNPPRLLAGRTVDNSSGLQRHKPPVFLKQAKRCPSFRCFT
jgi:hypothetical protein